MPRQQRIVGRLARTIAMVAEPRGWDVLESVAVRIRPRISCYPDLVVCERALETAKSLKASSVALVVQVESAWSRGIGRAEQRWAYAEAGIKAFWYVKLASSRPPTVQCYLLMDSGYVRQAVAGPGNPQWVSLPIGADVKLDVDELNR
ncbi:MAG TPA: Uma2 family endonuclease [Pseudonocardiaceae bacterium]